MDDSNSYYCVMQILNIQILNLLNQHLQELPLAIVIIEEQKISVMFAVPFMYKLLVSSRYSRDDYFNSLKKCISAIENAE